jgi:Flp pilus assembly protein TadG
MSKIAHIRKLIRDRRGSEMIEAALILGAFLFMLLGTFDFGQLVFVHQSMVERARMAARYAEVNLDTDLPTLQNLIMYGQPTNPGGGTTAAFGLTSANISRTQVSNGDVSQEWKITISNYHFSALSPLGGSFAMRPIVVAYTQQN